jgi:type II secretory pathway pseudopilin PulG
MKTSGQNKCAFTRLELIVTLSVLALVGGLVLLPLLTKATRAAKLQRCQDNLRQIGQGWLQYPAGHENKWPWELQVEKGGTRHLTNAASNFLVLSNSMKTSALVCPADPVLKPMTDWSEAPNVTASRPPGRGTSYFVGIDAVLRRPTLLAGDHDLGGTTPNTSCRNFNQNVAASLTRGQARAGLLQWTNRLHKRAEGNILLTDGSIRRGTGKILNEPLENWYEGEGGFGHHILPPLLP